MPALKFVNPDYLRLWLSEKNLDAGVMTSVYAMEPKFEVRVIFTARANSWDEAIHQVIKKLNLK